MLHQLQESRVNQSSYFLNFVDPDYAHTVDSSSRDELQAELLFVIKDGKDRWLGLQEVCENLYLVRRLLKMTKGEYVNHTLRPIEKCLVEAINRYESRLQVH